MAGGNKHQAALHLRNAVLTHFCGRTEEEEKNRRLSAGFRGDEEAFFGPAAGRETTLANPWYKRDPVAELLH